MSCTSLGRAVLIPPLALPWLSVPADGWADPDGLDGNRQNQTNL